MSWAPAWYTSPLPEGDPAARCLPTACAHSRRDYQPVVFLDFGAVGTPTSPPHDYVLLQCLEAFTVAKVGAVAIALRRASSQL